MDHAGAQIASVIATLFTRGQYGPADFLPQWGGPAVRPVEQTADDQMAVVRRFQRKDRSA